MIDGVSNFGSGKAVKVEKGGSNDTPRAPSRSAPEWRSNSPELRSLIPSELLESSPLAVQSQGQAPKALGIHWDVATDKLHISTPTPATPPEVVTKRLIASGTASVFDVLGLFAPAIIPARVILQELWRFNLSWDEPVPNSYAQRWILWLEHLPAIVEFAIPRRLSCSDHPVLFQALHGFADASSYADDAAVYIWRVHTDQGFFLSNPSPFQRQNSWLPSYSPSFSTKLPTCWTFLCQAYMHGPIVRSSCIGSPRITHN